MDDQTDFKHITVNAYDEEEVIVAGIPSQQAAETAKPEAADRAINETQHEPRPSRAEQTDSDGKSDAAIRDTDAYTGTTLEDIRSSRMPVAQKAVIALAVAGIAAFAVWSIISSGVSL